ncbi:hypothetical protein ERO13_D01G038732v2 [Gossypium hirsutum]|nr:hypothetical protein ERO13_D01G038732v2 [Gossypium hirsutum]
MKNPKKQRKIKKKTLPLLSPIPTTAKGLPSTEPRGESEGLTRVEGQR